MFSICLSKILYAVYLFIVARHIPSDLVVFTWSSPLYVGISIIVSNCIVKAQAKDRNYIIVGDLVYVLSIFLCLFINPYFILLSLITFAVDIYVLTKKKISIKHTKWAILWSVWQIIFIASGFSVYYKILELWLYIIIVILGIICFIPQTVSLVKKLGIGKNNFLNIGFTILFYFCIISWAIPFFFSIFLYDNAVILRIEYMIYGLLLSIYPYAKMLIVVRKQNGDLK